jgi:hypothetical protein
MVLVWTIAIYCSLYKLKLESGARDGSTGEEDLATEHRCDPAYLGRNRGVQSQHEMGERHLDLHVKA